MEGDPSATRPSYARFPGSTRKLLGGSHPDRVDLESTRDGAPGQGRPDCTADSAVARVTGTSLSSSSGPTPWLRSQRHRFRRFMSSKRKHYLIMALVVADVSVILTDIFVALVSCDMGLHDPWVDKVHEALKIVGLTFSSLFLLELLISIWAFGIRFFYSWFHCLDAVIIVASFVVEVLTHGVLEEIASIVIVLRLLRFVKVVDEISVGAAERLEDIDARAERLERENAELKRQLGELRR